MIEKIGTVKNPLTIIAMFAALAEVSGVVMLPFIASEHQGTFIWFLMIFPTLLVCFFFFTLYKKPQILYAPSDFRDEKNYMQIFHQATPNQRLLKRREELQETAGFLNNNTQNTASAPQGNVFLENKELLNRNIRGTYLLAEELVMLKLTKEFGVDIKRDVRLAGNNPHAPVVIFDGVAIKEKEIFFIEVKYLRDIQNTSFLFRSLKRMGNILNNLQISENVRILFIIVTDENYEKLAILNEQLDKLILNFNFNTEKRLFNLKELEQEFENSESK